MSKKKRKPRVIKHLEIFQVSLVREPDLVDPLCRILDQPLPHPMDMCAPTFADPDAKMKLPKEPTNDDN